MDKSTIILAQFSAFKPIYLLQEVPVIIKTIRNAYVFTTALFIIPKTKKMFVKLEGCISFHVFIQKEVEIKYIF